MNSRPPVPSKTRAPSFLPFPLPASRRPACGPTPTLSRSAAGPRRTTGRRDSSAAPPLGTRSRTRRSPGRDRRTPRRPRRRSGTAPQGLRRPRAWPSQSRARTGSCRRWRRAGSRRRSRGARRGVRRSGGAVVSQMLEERFNVRAYDHRSEVERAVVVRSRARCLEGLGFICQAGLQPTFIGQRHALVRRSR